MLDKRIKRKLQTQLKSDIKLLTPPINAEATAAAAASCHQINYDKRKQKKASCSLNDTITLGTISREAEIRTFWLRSQSRGPKWWT